jgi:hypothetical protein
MQTGDLVMFRGRGPVAAVIRWWTRSAWDHCGVLWVVEGEPLVLEARAIGGVSCHALRNRMKDDPTVFPTGRTVDVSMALRHLGDHYSVKDAIRAGLGEPGDHAGWECAEFAALILGLDHKARGWTPQGLIEALGGGGTSQERGRCPHCGEGE